VKELDRERDDVLRECLGLGRHRKDHYFLVQLPSGRQIIVGCSADAPWLDVFTERRRRISDDSRGPSLWKEHGFSLAESRWSHSEGPQGATEIRAALHEHFGASKKIGRFH